MKKNGEYVGVDDEYVPEDEKYVDDSLLGDKEETKRKIKKTAKKVAIGYILYVIITFGIFIGIAFLMISNFHKNTQKMTNQYNQMVADMKEEHAQKSAEMQEKYENESNKIIEKYNTESEKFNVSSFNSSFQYMQGTQGEFLLSGYLDKVVTNNKTNNNHTITVIYNDITAVEEDGIVGIKHSLKDGAEYEVSLDYDADGYINKVTIKDI